MLLAQPLQLLLSGGIVVFAPAVRHRSPGRALRFGFLDPRGPLGNCGVDDGRVQNRLRTVSSVADLRGWGAFMEFCMSMQNHLVELQRRHGALEREISTETTHPAADPTRLASLKRRKLHLKDEISRLRAPRH